MAISEGSISVNVPSGSPAILPLKVIYTPGQTVRETSSDQANAVVGINDEFTMARVADAPSELWFGAVASDYHILSGGDEDYAIEHSMGDFTGVTRGNLFFRLAAGVWRFSGQLALPGAQRGDVWRVMRVLFDGESTTDEVLAQSHSRPRAGADTPGYVHQRDIILMPRSPPVEITDHDVLYIAFGDETANGTGGSLWLGLEYEGPRDLAMVT